MEVAYIIGIIIGILIWAAILQSIIYSGTNTKQRMELEKKQLNILVLMAKKAGATDDELNYILEPPKKKGRLF